MLRVLTLSTLFPNAVQPTLGVFVERQTLGLAASDCRAGRCRAIAIMPGAPAYRGGRSGRALPFTGRVSRSCR
jgi:hypothetical protein